MYKWQWNIFYSINYWAIEYIYCLLKIFKELSNNLLDNSLNIMLFYNIQQMAVKYKKCTNGNEIFLFNENI